MCNVVYSCCIYLIPFAHEFKKKRVTAHCHCSVVVRADNQQYVQQLANQPDVMTAL